MTLRMLAAVGILYLIMMGSTFSSLGVVLPHMVTALQLPIALAASFLSPPGRAVAPLLPQYQRG